MWRLVLFIIVFTVFMVFITFNLENRCDISFGFTKLEQVPVFITIFVSFVAGLFCAMPLIFHFQKRGKEKGHKPLKSKLDIGTATPAINHKQVPGDDKIKQDAALARERFFSKRRGSNDT
jgi:uncharacterized integral membrane protein